MRPFDDWRLARMAGELARSGQALVLTLDTRAGPDTGIPDVDPSRGHAELQAANIASWKSFWAGSAPLSRPRNQWSPTCRPTGTQASVHLVKGNLPELDRLVQASLDSDACLGYVPVRGDLEHFHEDAAKVLGIVASGLPAIVSSPTHEKILFPEAFGSRVRLNLGGFSSNIEPVDSYWKNKAFLEVAGRELVPCSADGLLDTVWDFHIRGHRRVFLKSTEVKRGTWTLEVPDGSTRDSVRSSLWVLLREVLHKRNPSEAAYFVQPWLGFRREMRFFVVDGRILQAVPVRRADTIFDGTPGGRIEPRSCERHDGYPSEPDRRRAAAYTAVARRVIAHLQGAAQANRIHPRGDYVLDLGETSDGRILPIELNGINNSGNYAADPLRLVLALARSKARQMLETLVQDRRSTAQILVARPDPALADLMGTRRQEAVGMPILVFVASNPEARFCDAELANPEISARAATWNDCLAHPAINVDKARRGFSSFSGFDKIVPGRLCSPAFAAERKLTLLREASLLQAFSTAAVPAVLATIRCGEDGSRIFEARSVFPQADTLTDFDRSMLSSRISQTTGTIGSAHLAIRLLGLQIAGVKTALVCEQAWPWRTYAFDLVPNVTFEKIVARIAGTMRDALDGDDLRFTVYQWPEGGNIIRTLVVDGNHTGVACDLVPSHGNPVPHVPGSHAASNVRIAVDPKNGVSGMGRVSRELSLVDASVDKDGNQAIMHIWPAYADLLLSIDPAEVAACLRTADKSRDDGKEDRLAKLASEARATDPDFDEHVRHLVEERNREDENTEPVPRQVGMPAGTSGNTSEPDFLSQLLGDLLSEDV